jgi:hypothetical protein
MKKEWYIFTCLIIIIFLIGFSIGRYVYPNPEQVIRIDTLTQKVIIRDSIIRVEKAQAKLIIKRSIDTLIDTIHVNDTVTVYDTTYKVKPFIACLDTVLPTKDTLDARYYFPENVFDILVRPKPDTVEIKWITKVEKESESIWIKVGVAAAGLGVGYLFGVAK